MGNDNEGTEDDNEGTEDDNAENDDEGHNEDNNLGNNKLDNDEVKDNDGNDLFSVFCMFFYRICAFFGNFLIPLCLLSGHWPYASSLRTFFVHFLNLFRPSGYLAEAACHQACKSNRGF